MTSRKRPSLRDNLTEGASTDLQLAQVAALEERRRARPADTAPTQADVADAPPAAARAVAGDVAVESAVLTADKPEQPEPASPGKAEPPKSEQVRADTDQAAVQSAQAPSTHTPATDPMASAAIARAWEPSPQPSARSATATPAYTPTRQPVLPDRRTGESERRLAFIIGLGVASVIALGATWFGIALSDTRSMASQRAAALESQIRVLESQLASERKANADRTAVLEAAVAELRSPLEQAAGGASVMGILTAQQLRQALNGSGPFHDQLALFRTSNFGNAELTAAIEPIAPRALEGIASKAELAGMFAEIVPAVLAAEMESINPRTTGISQTMWSWMTSLPGAITGGSAPPAEVPVEPPVIPDEDRPAALLARAGLMLEAGDLAGAIERLSRLPEPTANVATPWIEEARMRIAADQVSRLLAGRIDELLAAVNR